MLSADQRYANYKAAVFECDNQKLSLRLFRQQKLFIPKILCIL